MKVLLSLIGLVLLVALVWMFLPAMEIDRATKATLGPPADAPKHDFKAVSELLQADMDQIPQQLMADRVIPAHAFAIRSQLQGAVGRHEEYRVLDTVCELIIHADQEHSIRQRDCQVAQTRLYTSPLNDDAATTSQDAHKEATALNQTRREKIASEAETAWSSSRKQMVDEVHRQLAALENKQL